MTPRTPQCEVFWALLPSSKHSGVPRDSKPPTFPSVGLHPHTWSKWGCHTFPERWTMVWQLFCLRSSSPQKQTTRSIYPMHFPNFSILRPWSLFTIRLSPNSGSSHPLVTNATKEVFWALLSSSEHSGIPEDSKPPTFPSVGLHAHTWPKWGYNMCHKALDLDILMFNIQHTYICVWDGWIMYLVPLKGRWWSFPFCLSMCASNVVH